MKYLIMALLFIVLLTLWIIFLIRKKKAIKKVLCTTTEEKLSYINAALNPFGFTFDLNSDIVISKNDAWQREFGYMDLYDLKAPFFRMVMHAEPIFFNYDKKEYRLEFWKGQYGLTTGAEIGLYIRDYCSPIPGFYRAATDEERIKMGFMLYKDCCLMERKDLSWWLTGFDIGRFSKPKDLRLKICLKFPCEEMQNAFVKALMKAGYAKDLICVSCNIVCFEMCCPKNYKLNHHYKIVKFFAQILNRFNCSIYRKFTKYFNRTLDKLTYIRYMFPHLYNFVIKISIPRRKIKKLFKKKCKTSHK